MRQTGQRKLIISKASQTVCRISKSLQSTQRRIRNPPVQASSSQHTHTASPSGQASTSTSSRPHTPVLVDEVLSYFAGRQLHSFVDGTLGAGGHAGAILQAHPELQHFLGLDVDPHALTLAQPHLEAIKQSSKLDTKLVFARKNYSELEEAVADGWKADGILLDLGISSMQMDTAARGFSISRDGPLDMRMGPSACISAEQIVNTWAERDLGQIFRDYGEERHWRGFASRLVNAREHETITTTKQLVQALGHMGNSRDARQKRGPLIHPCTRVFQALRIAVNKELQHLKSAIPSCMNCLATGGRVAVISFHSLEDRIVKHEFLKASGKSIDASASLYAMPQNLPVLGTVLTRKPVIPTDDEQNINPRSRSAKLRVFEKL